jgi:SAM-dependent methyltransferase
MHCYLFVNPSCLCAFVVKIYIRTAHHHPPPPFTRLELPQMPPTESKPLTQALWNIYRRPERPETWQNDGNLPWNDPAFSERMLREHLDQSHGAASRTDSERAVQLDWLWQKLALQADHHLLDLTCGPGLYAVPLAERGCQVVGVDFSPASIRHARALAQAQGVSQRCQFVEQDIRQGGWPVRPYQAALLLYGQLAVFPKTTARHLLETIAQQLEPGGTLAIELLNPARIDRQNSTWWFTDDTGLWGDSPFLHLGERFWNEETLIATERFLTLHLESGQLDEVILSDQAYPIAEMTAMLQTAGFAGVETWPAWDGLPLSDAAEWVVYVARRG